MNLETFKELLLKQQSSGLTVKAFCEQEHLSMSNWCYWKRKCTTPMQDALVPMQLQHKVLGRAILSRPWRRTRQPQSMPLERYRNSTR